MKILLHFHWSASNVDLSSVAEPAPAPNFWYPYDSGSDFQNNFFVISLKASFKGCKSKIKGGADPALD